MFYVLFSNISNVRIECQHLSDDCGDTATHCHITGGRIRGFNTLKTQTIHGVWLEHEAYTDPDPNPMRKSCIYQIL